MLAISATSVSVKRNTISSRDTTRSGLNSSGGGAGGSSRSLQATQFKMDDNYDHTASNRLAPIVTSTKATKCIRPKEWSPEVEEAFRVQQTRWRDLKEYMETYGQPECWDNGFIRCTRVKSNGYYTYCITADTSKQKTKSL
ncbi:Meiosis expressed protein, partial [Globisporangium splendens]